jgi:hypothetical protein
MVVDRRLGTVERQLFQNINQLLTLTSAVLTKGVVLEDDLRVAWETDVKPRIDTAMDEVQREAAAEQAPAATDDVDLGP